MTIDAAGELVDERIEGGHTLELRRRGEAYDVWLDGRRAIASDERRSEQALVELGLAPLQGRDDISVLVAGLGMGFCLQRVLSAAGLVRVDVVESSPAIIEWERRYFAQLNGDAGRDARVHLHNVELGQFLAAERIQPTQPEGWFAVVLDLDEGAEKLTLPSNATFYEEAGLNRLERVLRPGGVLALWTPQRDTALLKRLSGVLQNVAELAVPVDIAGQFSLDYVYRGRRHPQPAAAAPAPQN